MSPPSESPARSRTKVRFGEGRLVRRTISGWHRTFYRVFGVADPAQYLHYVYLRRQLSLWRDFSPTAILDAGCGSGDHSLFLARYYGNARVVGIDIDRAAITTASAESAELGVGNVSFVAGDLASLAIEEEFDLVVSIDALEHIVEQSAALACLAKALRPGGRAFFHIPTSRPRPVPFSRHLGAFHAWAAEEHRAAEHTAASFAKAVEESGLEVDRITPTFGFLTGELATSLFALPYRNTPLNRVAQIALAPICRALAAADPLLPSSSHFAVAVAASKPTVG